MTLKARGPLIIIYHIACVNSMPMLFSVTLTKTRRFHADSKVCCGAHFFCGNLSRRTMTVKLSYDRDSTHTMSVEVANV